jgi:hypothetical protein
MTSGRNQQSASVKSIQSAVARAAPTWHAYDLPSQPSGSASTLTVCSRASCVVSLLRMSGVPSLDRSSTTITSSTTFRCASRQRIVLSSRASSSRAATITEQRRHPPPSTAVPRPPSASRDGSRCAHRCWKSAAAAIAKKSAAVPLKMKVRMVKALRQAMVSSTPCR